MKKRTAKAGIFGAIVGALAGIFLLAPKGASQNRRDVARAAMKTQRETEKKLKKAYYELQAQRRKVRTQARRLTGKAKDEAQALENKVQALIDQTKELITTVREGDDEVDKQVQKVLSEAAKLKNTVTQKAKRSIRQAADKVKDA